MWVENTRVDRLAIFHQHYQHKTTQYMTLLFLTNTRQLNTSPCYFSPTQDNSIHHLVISHQHYQHKTTQYIALLFLTNTTNTRQLNTAHHLVIFHQLKTTHQHCQYKTTQYITLLFLTNTANIIYLAFIYVST